MKTHSERLGKEPIGKLLVKLSLPATVGMLVNALYNLVDTIFVGQGVGPDAIGGLAIAFPIQMIIMGIAIMIGVGAASAISRYLGAGDTEKADHVAGNSYILILFLSIIWAVIGMTFTDPLLKIFGATETLLPYARDYIRIIFFGSIFFSFAVTSNNLIRAEGNAKAAMISMLIGTGLNIILDPIFIFLFSMGIKGAAYATIISQFASFIYVVIYFYSGKSALRIMPHHLKFNLEISKEIITVGMPAFLRNIVGSIIAIVLNNSLGFYGGDLAIIVYGAMNRVVMFVFMPVFGVVQGMQPILGFNYGAKLFDRARKTIKLSLATTVFMMTISAIFVLIFPKLILRMFTSDVEILEMGAVAVRYIFIAFPVIGIQIISGSVYQALGKAVPAILLSLLRQLILLIPLVLILPRLGLGLTGIWLSFPISDFVSTFISGILLKKEINKMQ